MAQLHKCCARIQLLLGLMLRFLIQFFLCFRRMKRPSGLWILLSAGMCPLCIRRTRHFSHKSDFPFCSTCSYSILLLLKLSDPDWVFAILSPSNYTHEIQICPTHSSSRKSIKFAIYIFDLRPPIYRKLFDFLLDPTFTYILLRGICLAVSDAHKQLFSFFTSTFSLMSFFSLLGVLWLSLQDVYGIRATALIFAKSTTTTTEASLSEASPDEVSVKVRSYDLKKYKTLALGRAKAFTPKEDSTL